MEHELNVEHTLAQLRVAQDTRPQGWPQAQGDTPLVKCIPVTELRLGMYGAQARWFVAEAPSCVAASC